MVRDYTYTVADNDRYHESDQHNYAHRHSSSRRRRRHRHHSQPDEESPRISSHYRIADESEPEELSRAHNEYYGRAPEGYKERDRRTHAYDQMASERHTSVRRRHTPEKPRVSESRNQHQRGGEKESRRRRSKRLEDTEEDSRNEYVYRGRDSSGSPRRTNRTIGDFESVRNSRRPGSLKSASKPLERTVKDRHPQLDTSTSRSVRRVPSVTRLSTPKGRRNSSGLLALFRPQHAYTPVPEKRVECVVCLLDDMPSSKAARLRCGHYNCHACLKRQFELSVTDPQHMPPRCCTAEHIPLKHVDRLFSDNFKMQWNKKYVEYTTKNRIYCPTRGCGEWIKPGNIRMDATVGRRYARCTKCRRKACVLCSGKWHISRDCPKDEEARTFAEMAKDKGWQRCYNCKAMVELKEGCYHMTCRCNAQFCMLCAAKWKTCTCPWFDHPELDPADRLLNMQIPHTYQIPVSPRRPQSLSLQYPRPPQPPAAPIAPTSPLRRSHTTYNPLRRNLSTRERTSNAEFSDPRPSEYSSRSRFLQTQQIPIESSAPRLSSRRPTNRNTDIQVYSVGNAGAHHLNESYTVRPLNQPHSLPISGPALDHLPSPQPLQQTPVQAARHAWLGMGNMLPPARRHSISTREQPRWTRSPPRKVREKETASLVAASVMAGLAKNGSKTGANRVDTWRKHVRHDAHAVRVPDGGFVDEVWEEDDIDEGYVS